MVAKSRDSPASCNIKAVRKSHGGWGEEEEEVVDRAKRGGGRGMKV